MSNVKILTPAELKAVARSLREPVRKPKRHAATTLVNAIASTGWASIEDIKDIFYLTDVRLDDITGDVKVQRWCEYFDIPSRTIYPRPRSKQTGVIGCERVAAADVAALLIQLERLGYSLDPLPLVQLLMQTVRSTQLLTSSQLSVLWYEQCRHKGEPLVLNLAHGQWPQIKDTETLQTATGYKIEIAVSGDGSPVWLSAGAPKFRKRPAMRRELCTACGYEWTRGDTDSSADHRREHKKRLAYLEPGPVPEFLAEVAARKDAALVECSSPPWKHREIYRRALAFKREFGYDFVQWQSEKGDDDPSVQGILFTNAENVIVGACAIRLREYEGKSWPGLQWIWLAPKYRRIGILTSQWSQLRRRFGDIRVEPPVSPAMQAFLKKMGDEALMGA